MKPLTLDDLVLAYMGRVSGDDAEVANASLEGRSMIRFSWLQARIQTIWGIGAIAIIAAALGISGPRLAHLYHDHRCDLPRPEATAPPQ